MFILLLLFALIRTLHGIPMVMPAEPLDGFPALDVRDIHLHFGQRDVNNILISCFATIFACTWGAVHPNIPATTDCWWTCVKRQVVTLLCALLAPEAMSSWALRQRLSARDIIDEYNKKIPEDEIRKPGSKSIGTHARELFRNAPIPPPFQEGKGPKWTLTHGFFVEMGGFVLCERGRPIRTLRLASDDSDSKLDVIWNIQNGVIDTPLITEEDIWDRSKGDAISKTLIIFQTTWFMIQCIARWSQHLPVTELEALTLGFAILNGITYALWWHKPQNVTRPVFLEIKPKPQEGPNVNHENSSATENDPNFHELHHNESWFWKRLRDDLEKQSFSTSWKLPFLMPLRLLSAMLRPVSKMAAPVAKMTTNDGKKFVRPQIRRVSMFYAGGAKHRRIFFINLTVGIIFGLVHLIFGWVLDFSTPLEMWLWRASSIEMTTGPIFFQTWSYLGSVSKSDSDPGRLFHIVGGICIVGLPFYIFSRIALLTLALTSLHSLPPDALVTIDWTSSVPHF